MARKAARDYRRLEPHTSEWFDALLLQNSTQALHTMATIQASGRADGCSACADRPAPVCQLVDPLPPAYMVQTMRLCADCMEIRRAMHGETYELVL